MTYLQQGGRRSAGQHTGGFFIIPVSPHICESFKLVYLLIPLYTANINKP